LPHGPVLRVDNRAKGVIRARTPKMHNRPVFVKSIKMIGFNISPCDQLDTTPS